MDFKLKKKTKRDREWNYILSNGGKIHQHDISRYTLEQTLGNKEFINEALL